MLKVWHFRGGSSWRILLQKVSRAAKYIRIFQQITDTKSIEYDGFFFCYRFMNKSKVLKNGARIVVETHILKELVFASSSCTVFVHMMTSSQTTQTIVHQVHFLVNERERPTHQGSFCTLSPAVSRPRRVKPVQNIAS